MLKHKKSGIIGVILTIFILLCLVIITKSNLEHVSYIEIIGAKTVTPIKNMLTYLKNNVEGNESFFRTIEELKSENDELRDKNKQLEQKVSELEIIKAENNTLKEYAKIIDSFPEYEIILATIISKNISNINDVITINAGEKQEIEKNMTVITADGLVGHVISVAEESSKVQLIIDTSDTVSAMISNNREAIICRGSIDEKNTLRAMYISTDSIISKGDKVETSGMGGIYPKGIEIGEIKEVINTKNITDRYAIINTNVDFNKLEYVGVLKITK